MSGYSPILCGKCRAPVKLTIDAEWRATVACLSCGAADTFDSAVREANEYLTDACLREVARRSGDMWPPPRCFRFIRSYEPQ
jgi:hypothetical protein